jgi:predicted DNA-binding transcriptional regulator AlpA
MTEENDDLTTKEVAQRLGITVKAVDLYCRRGLFPGRYKLGRDWRIPESDLALPHIVNRRRGRPDGFSPS